MTVANVERVAVLGLGRSGDAVVRWALDRPGASANDVTVFTEHDTPSLDAVASVFRAAGVRVELGVKTLPDDGFDLVVASPGISPSRPLLRSAIASGVPVISELELAYRMSTAPFVAITGTNGKTTTTALVTHLLRTAGSTAIAVGNIGVPAILGAPGLGPDAVVVAECSSFQLALTIDFHPRVAVLLNVTPDHIDWHGSLEVYASDKGRVFANLCAGDVAVIDIDDPGSARWVAVAQQRGAKVVRVGLSDGDARVEDGWLVVDAGAGDGRLIRVEDLLIRGTHNVSNALAAAAAALALGVPADALREGLRTFEPIEHRLDPVATIAGVEYVNDSKATNPEAVAKALTAFGSSPVIVLLGGRNKGNDFRPLAELCGTRCRLAVLFGEARPELEVAFDAMKVPYVSAPTMAEALLAASRAACPGDIVLLSPACASFDEFSDYEERGRSFAETVMRYAKETR
ncbi:MAG TPA: UDP-N-acetylmuramoyl-L-alanine--D-glutamate ligase [Coriobacteriia bacterium]